MADGNRLGIGIDFGTSNSAAAVFDGEALRLVELEGYHEIIPSATYIDRDLQTEVGQPDPQALHVLHAQSQMSHCRRGRLTVLPAMLTGLAFFGLCSPFFLCFSCCFIASLRLVSRRSLLLTLSRFGLDLGSRSSWRPFEQMDVKRACREPGSLPWKSQG